MNSSPLSENYLDETKRIMDFVAKAPCIPFAIGDSIKCNNLCTPPVIYFEDQSLSFPLTNVSNLLTKGTKATFGRNSKEVLDLEYRNAIRFDTQEFAPSFHPSEWPQLVQKIRTELFVEGNIRIERYRMNVYTTDGMFKTHQDTPKTTYGQDKHIASLVVCLPSAFEGGILNVQGSRKGRSVDVAFDWSKMASEGDCIQWAAFYADSPHHIEPVTKGNRLTITYDIFEEPLFDATTIKENLRTTDLVIAGQKIATKNRFCSANYVSTDSEEDDMNGCADHHHFIYFCEHQYSDAEECSDDFLLKGTDLLMYKLIKKATNCHARVISGSPVVTRGFDNFEPCQYEWRVSESENTCEWDCVSAIAVNSPVFSVEQDVVHYGNGPGPSQQCYRPAVVVFCTNIKRDKSGSKRKREE